MRSCLVLGSPRGGTSLLAGTLSRSGYFMGDHLWPLREYNPKGYFEDREVNLINNRLIARATKPSGERFGRLLRRSFPQAKHWLALIPVGRPIRTPISLARQIAALTRRQPFCLKDPRFCYTLPAWRPYLGDAVLLCVFREPARTAYSIVNSCRTNPALQWLEMTAECALQIWMTMYRHVLEIHIREGEWVFVHYEQILDGSFAPRLAAVLGGTVDRSFADPALRRSPNAMEIRPEIQNVYARLCELASYDPRRASTVAAAAS